MAPQHLVLRAAVGPEGGDPFKPEQLDAIAAATLRRCELNEKGLRSLDISGMVFSTLFMSQFASAVGHNTELREIYLDNGSIGDEGARLLAHGLAHNASHFLRVLSLEDNQIGCRGATHLAKVLENGSRWSRTFGGFRAPACAAGSGLQYLSLAGNAVAAAGAKALAEVLMRSDDSLETLNLEGNRIGDWAVGWLAVALKNHSVLKCLNLKANPIGSDGLEELRTTCRVIQATLRVVRAATAEEAAPDAGGGSASTDTPAAPGGRDACEARSETDLVPPTGATAVVYVSEASFELALLANNFGDTKPLDSGAFAPSAAYRKTSLGMRRQMSSNATPFSMSSSYFTDGPASDGKSSGRATCRSGSNRGVFGRRQPRRKRMPPPEAPTFPAGPVDGVAARPRPAERGVGAEEKEACTSMGLPSRWRRKPRDTCVPESAGASAPAASGCGAAAVRRLRPQSAPAARRPRGMLLGPAASSAVSCGAW